MKWASLPLLALVLSLPFDDRAVSQTLQPREQIRQRVNENVLFLMGGQPGATFSQLAHDISVVVDSNDLRVLPVIGGAAVQNVQDVVFLRSIDMALTTQEAMNHLKATGELGPNLEQRVTYIATLFPNPLQILARADAKSIKDLSGKKVNFNNKGSATAQFVPQIFKTLGVNVQQELFMPQGDALEKLRNGELDATICSCPAPVPAFANVKPEWGLRLVTVPYEGAIQESYLPARMRHEDYPALIGKEEAVDTIAAVTVLISFNWPKDTVRYQRTAKFVDALFSKLSEFQKPPRHPSWKAVNLSATIPGWPRFAAAEEWLRNRRREMDFDKFMSERTAIQSTEQTKQLLPPTVVQSAADQLTSAQPTHQAEIAPSKIRERPSVPTKVRSSSLQPALSQPSNRSVTSSRPKLVAPRNASRASSDRNKTVAVSARPDGTSKCSSLEARCAVEAGGTCNPATGDWLWGCNAAGTCETRYVNCISRGLELGGRERPLD